MGSLINRDAGVAVHTFTGVEAATPPSVAPTGAAAAEVAKLKANIHRGATRAWVTLTAGGAATLGAGGAVWLCRYSISRSKWLKCARLASGLAIVLSATLGHDEPLDEVLADSSGFAIYDQGGATIGATVVTVQMGALSA
ncbi:MAG: hypothetical protein M3R63_18535 [Actinomycetota bacterium]|nr:hypothetical protein [Actinomycetota bacterium]